ncbi:MAG TPA: indole-3-glycerol phosphate synthase TrpC [Dehalococcoidia bacterium]|jgi:indole-3-glycerol phosphate synthase|nr:indole-3-glycerol phosphate synthase TrpC [Dehalococcoidia bacterium]
MPDDIIDRIVADKRIEVEERKQQEPLDALKRRQDRIPTEQWSLVRSILEGPRGPSSGGRRMQLIAEIKKATPSKGRLVPVLEHRAMARTYTIGGAAGISILTESKYFQGSIDFLSDCRVSIDGYYPGGRPAMLRKDFMFDPYQVYESRAYGADAILLIVSIVTDDELKRLVDLAHELQLECVVEVASEQEVERALRVDSDLIGINNRDLRTFEVDLAVTERLRPLIPQEKVVVALSGVRNREDTERMARAGVHAVLVGEALVTSKDVREKMRDFLV